MSRLRGCMISSSVPAFLQVRSGSLRIPMAARITLPIWERIRMIRSTAQQEITSSWMDMYRHCRYPSTDMNGVGEKLAGLRETQSQNRASEDSQPVFGRGYRGDGNDPNFGN